MNTDLTFITNEPGHTLKERFQVLIKDSHLFDCLVGYFYISGFNTVYKPLEKTEKIRILIGIGTTKETYDLLESAQDEKRQMLQFSHAETKEKIPSLVEKEMEESDDNEDVENGVNKFIEWINSNKLEIRAYPSKNLHAKLYIMTFREGDRDIGRVITGSSNFTQAGLVENLEFNVELKNSSDYEFAKRNFEELWKDAVDVSEEYINTIKERTWLRNVSPYELYLKCLYEYFREKIDLDKEEISKGDFFPKDFIDLEYQREAVVDAKNKLESYNGVFLADVVGLGKTYISALLAKQLNGRHLVICPPILKEYWEDTFRDFNIPATVESLGKLDNILKIKREYKNVFIDEAHRFRNESTITYDKLQRICKDRNVILVSATPQNNTAVDILSQIKLFQEGNNSSLPNLKNIDSYFNRQQGKLKDIDRSKDFERYIKIKKEISKNIRENVLKYLIVRRTRNDIRECFSKDLKKKGFNFPDITLPKKLYYIFDEKTDRIFNETVNKIKDFKYTRYIPLLYLIKLDPKEEIGQRNMRRFMKVLLVKRLESSFYAFKKTIDRFIYSYEQFIDMFNKGIVYTSKKYSNKIFELIENDSIEEITKLIDEGKAKKYSSNDFEESFIKDLKNDLDILKDIKNLWEDITTDPKIDEFKRLLREELENKKVVVFTESMETADYLEKELKDSFRIISYSSKSSKSDKYKIIENFDPRYDSPKDDIDILITTNILSEGVNLHRSNIVINYDIPWNPIRIIQRVGRINRVDSKFKKIYIYNFFPTVQADSEIGLKEAAIGKLQSFHEILGEDMAYLTESEEVTSFELFQRLNSNVIDSEEEESELKYLSEIRNIRDNNPELFEKIKNLPKKARSAKKYPTDKNSVITFFRRGKLMKFYISDEKNTEELDFLQSVKTLKSDSNVKREKLGDDFYNLLNKNKKEFESLFTEYIQEQSRKGSKGSDVKLQKIVKALIKEDEIHDNEKSFLRNVLYLLDRGALSKWTTKNVLKKISRENNPIKIYKIIKDSIPSELLSKPSSIEEEKKSYPIEVILSEYLVKEG